IIGAQDCGSGLRSMYSMRFWWNVSRLMLWMAQKAVFIRPGILLMPCWRRSAILTHSLFFLKEHGEPVRLLDHSRAVFTIYGGRGLMCSSCLYIYPISTACCPKEK